MVKFFSNPFNQVYVFETQMNFSCKNDFDLEGCFLEIRYLDFRILRCQFSLYLNEYCEIMNFKF